MSVVSREPTAISCPLATARLGPGLRRWRVAGLVLAWLAVIALAVACDRTTQALWDRYLGGVFAVHVVSLALADLLRIHSLVLGLVLAMCLDRRLPRDLLQRAAWVLVAQMVLASLLKQLFGRARPGEGVPVHLFTGPTLDHSSFSFPSGHAALAFALAGFLAAFYPRWRWLLLTGAALVGLARVDLGRHYLGDVIAGGVLGWYCAVLVVGWLRRRRVARRARQEALAPAADC